MAKSDSDSNGLRQDQPECIPARGRGVRRDHTHKGCGRYRRVFEDTRRPSVTELSGLTSDPILTADRRGGILIYSGPVCSLEAFIKASSLFGEPHRLGPGRSEPVASDRASCASIPNTLLHLRASDGGWGRRGSAPRRLRISSEDGVTLNPVELHPLRHAIPWAAVSRHAHGETDCEGETYEDGKRRDRPEKAGRPGVRYRRGDRRPAWRRYPS